MTNQPNKQTVLCLVSNPDSGFETMLYLESEKLIHKKISGIQQGFKLKALSNSLTLLPQTMADRNICNLGAITTFV